MSKPLTQPQRPQKHSLTLHGHRTSVSLEPAFWEAFLQMARERGLAINALAAEVDAQRVGGAQGLATAIRLAVLDHVQARLQRAEARIDRDLAAAPGSQSAGPG